MLPLLRLPRLGDLCFSISPAAVAKPAAVRSSDLFMQMTAPAGWQQINEELWEGDADIRIEGGSMPRRSRYARCGARPVHDQVALRPSDQGQGGAVDRADPLRPRDGLRLHGWRRFPIKATLQFKKVRPVLKVSTDSTFEFPLQCGVFVPTPEESARIGETTKAMFYNAPMKHKVQGGSTIDNKGGAIRTFNVEQSWEKTQLMVWSKDVGKKSFKSNIEILQGPNNAKQFLNLRCGGSTQPFHCVIDTPGPGWMIRCNSKKYLEDGLFEIACAPYGNP